MMRAIRDCEFVISNLNALQQFAYSAQRNLTFTDDEKGAVDDALKAGRACTY